VWLGVGAPRITLLFIKKRYEVIQNKGEPVRYNRKDRLMIHDDINYDAIIAADEMRSWMRVPMDDLDTIRSNTPYTLFIPGGLPNAAVMASWLKENKIDMILDELRARKSSEDSFIQYNSNIIRFATKEEAMMFKMRFGGEFEEDN
jgi:hypothetical protein